MCRAAITLQDAVAVVALSLPSWGASERPVRVRLRTRKQRFLERCCLQQGCPPHPQPLFQVTGKPTLGSKSILPSGMTLVLERISLNKIPCLLSRQASVTVQAPTSSAQPATMPCAPCSHHPLARRTKCTPAQGIASSGQVLRPQRLTARTATLFLRRLSTIY